LAGHRLGIELTRSLIEAARRRGIRTLTAFVLPDNTPMLGLLRRLDLPERVRYDDGFELIEIDLTSHSADPGCSVG